MKDIEINKEAPCYEKYSSGQLKEVIGHNLKMLEDFVMDSLNYYEDIDPYDRDLAAQAFREGFDRIRAALSNRK